MSRLLRLSAVAAAGAVTLASAGLMYAPGAAASTAAANYNCQTSATPLVSKVYTFGVSVNTDLPASATSAGIAARPATVAITVPQALLSDAKAQGYTSFSGATSNNFALSSTFGSTEGTHAVSGVSQSGTVNFTGTAPVTVSANGSLSAIAVPTGFHGTGQVRLPDRDNAADPWFPSKSTTNKLAFTLSVKLSGSSGTYTAQLRCGYGDTSVKGAALQSVSVA